MVKERTKQSLANRPDWDELVKQHGSPKAALRAMYANVIDQLAAEHRQADEQTPPGE